MIVVLHLVDGQHVLEAGETSRLFGSRFLCNFLLHTRQVFTLLLKGLGTVMLSLQLSAKQH